MQAALGVPTGPPQVMGRPSRQGRLPRGRGGSSVLRVRASHGKVTPKRPCISHGLDWPIGSTIQQPVIRNVQMSCPPAERLHDAAVIDSARAIHLTRLDHV